MNKTWEPEFENWSEGKVSMSSCELATNSMSRGDYGVVMQIAPDEEVLPVDAAIFWTDEMHLYLRYNWESWYKVSTDDPDNCSNICKRNSATLLLCTTSSITHRAVKVYHIETLPEDIFGPQVGGATRKDVEIPPPPAMPQPDLAAPEAFAEKIRKMGGQFLSCMTNGPYRADVCELNGHIVITAHFNRDGDWLADEDPLDGDAPSWYGTKSIATSPLAYVKTLREALSTLIPPSVPVLTLVILNSDCNIINEKECRREWAESNVEFSRYQRLDDSKIAALEELLKEVKGEPRPELAELAPKIDEAMSSWTPDPSTTDE